MGVASIALAVDGGAWQTATGTTSWSWSWNTTTLANGTHTLAVRATDTSGNVSTATESVTVGNTTSSASPPDTQGSWVSPEGVHINVSSAGTNPDTGKLWTIADVYNLLQANALALSTVGPTLTIDLQDTYATMTTCWATQSGTTYSNFGATIYLKGVNANFATWPDYVFTHEYGEVWATYYMYMNHQGSWSDWLNNRLDEATYNGTYFQYLGQDTRLNSAQTWQPVEIIADDYRLLFASAAAISESPTNINNVIVDPRNQPGLGSWLLNQWA